MNTTIFRSIAAAATSAVVFSVAACGDEVAPPANDVSRGKVVQERSVPAPQRPSVNRMDFRDENGSAKPRGRKHEPAGSRTRDRMDFAENHGR
jgi:hypothetical protein